jgi:hypothetical protein
MRLFRVGDPVEIPINFDLPEGKTMPGTVTQIGKHKVRVLVPIRKFVWVPVDLVKRGPWPAKQGAR